MSKGNKKKKIANRSNEYLDSHDKRQASKPHERVDYEVVSPRGSCNLEHSTMKKMEDKEQQEFFQL